MKLRNPSAAERREARAMGYELVRCSKHRTWFIGLKQVMFGVRVVAWRHASAGPCVDYCAGADPAVCAALLAMVIAIFQRQLKEDDSETSVSRRMPEWSVRPINQDPACWSALETLATLPPP